MKLANLVKANKEATVSTIACNKEMLVRNTLNNAYYIWGKRIADIPIELLEIDEYQRIVGKTTKRLMEEWEDEKCDFLYVSYRNGKFYIIDGQHRFISAKAIGITSLPCIIFEGLSKSDEAYKFSTQGNNVDPLSPYEKFHANIICGNENIPEVKTDMEIKRICDKYNIEVKKYGRYSSGKTLRCLTRARKIIDTKSYGVACFEWIIDLLNVTDWADIHNTYIREVILMLKNFWIDNKGDAELEKKLIEVLNSTTPTMMITRAKHCYPNHGVEVAMGLCLRDMLNEN